jgi:HEAT repeat protein
LHAKDKWLRIGAAIGLGMIADKSALEALIKTLKDDVAAVRKHAVWALATIGDERAVPPIEQLQNDKDPAVRKEVSLALSHLRRPPAAVPLQSDNVS